ncbi:MAG: NAD(P)-binding domain-containing protein [Actinobacteria bacterium]|nr:NAD(P)-binding domain-containing protein [Actinomycetota bacterium]
MRIAIVGTGMVGRALAGGLASAGHDVVIGTRDPHDTMARTEPDRMGNPPFAEWHRHHAGIGLQPLTDVGAGAEIVINATSGMASLEALEAVGAEALADKPLIDVANPLDFSTGRLALFTTSTDSLAERIQRTFPDARVVKALNTMNASVMTSPSSIPGDHLAPIAGDDEDAKGAVRSLLADLGWRDEQILDLGALTAARGMEAWLLLWIELMQTLGTPRFNLSLSRP